jgi:signal transduction histidine kinase
MRWRLLGSFFLIILIALGTVAIVTRYTTEQEVQTFLGHGGQVGLENLANALRSYYATNQTWEGVDAQLRGNQGRGQGIRASANVFWGEHTLADPSGVVLLGPSAADIGTVLSREVLDQSIPLEVSGAVVGYLVPEGGILQLPDNFEELLIERVNRATLLAALVSGGLAILLSLLFAALILRPVRSLTHAAQNMANGDFSQRVKVREGGELGTLGETFNQMSESLQEAESLRKALTADIAHELRNPLAIQRAHLEALQDGVFPLNRENLDLVVEQNQQLTRLVDDLRTLALADAGELALNKRPINLTDICRETAARFEPQAALKKVTLVSNCVEGPLYAIADKERLQQIHDNLMQNALRYSPEGGWIVLTLSQQEKWGVFTLHNNGPQIPQEALGHLFERFYRGDKARDRASGGTGLGLAIARKLAEAHGGTLTGANHPDGGVVFTLSLPL